MGIDPVVSVPIFHLEKPHPSEYLIPEPAAPRSTPTGSPRGLRQPGPPEVYANRVAEKYELEMSHVTVAPTNKVFR